MVRVLCFLFFQTSIDTNFKSGHFSIIFSDISTEGQINSQLVFFLNTLLDIGDIARHDWIREKKQNILTSETNNNKNKRFVCEISSQLAEGNSWEVMITKFTNWPIKKVILIVGIQLRHKQVN